MSETDENGIEVEIFDVAGDRIEVTDKIVGHYRDKLGAIGCVSLDGRDADGDETEHTVALDRESFVRLRDTIDAIVARHDAAKNAG